MLSINKCVCYLLVGFSCVCFSHCGSSLKERSKDGFPATEEREGSSQSSQNTDAFLQEFFSCKDVSQINHFIDPEMGLIILYANGCYPQYKKLDSVSLDKTSYDLPYWIIEDILQCLDFKNTHIDTFQHTDSPVFNGEVILQHGAFIDESDDKNIMSKTIQHLTRITLMEDGDIGYLNKLEKDYHYYKDLESKSIRVILTDNASEKRKIGIRIYHFTEKQDRLYLTLLDFYSIDASV